jgi:hypothetical protein
MAVGVDGNPITAHDLSSNDGMRVTHCDDVVCTTSTTTEYQLGSNTGDFISLTIGTDGLAVISHGDATTISLVVTHLSKSAWTNNGWDSTHIRRCPLPVAQGDSRRSRSARCMPGRSRAA